MYFNAEPVRVRRIAADDDVIGGCVIKPTHRAERLFPGWGPKLFALLFAASLACASAHPGDARQLAQADCSVADRPASVIDAVQPTYPQLDWTPDDRTVAVQVDLSSTGELIRTSIAQSSRVLAFDHEALLVARESRYKPALEHCRAVGGTFVYLVTFDR